MDNAKFVDFRLNVRELALLRCAAWRMVSDTYDAYKGICTKSAGGDQNPDIKSLIDDTWNEMKEIEALATRLSSVKPTTRGA